MSKQVNDQDDVKSTSTDASQGVPNSTDKPTSTPDATASSTPPSATTSSQNGANATKGRSSRRRGKGTQATNTSTASSANAHVPDTSTANSRTSETRASASEPAKNTSASSSTPAKERDSTSTAPSATAASPSTTSSTASTKPNSDKSSSHTGTTPPSGHKGSGNSSGNGNGKGGGSKGSGVAIALVIILAAALALVAWQGFQRLESQQQRLDELAQQTDNTASQQAVDELASRLDSGEEERDVALQSALDELRSEFESYRSDVDETLGQVLDQLSQAQDTDEREWLHAEAAYLLRLANQRLQFEGDVEGAAALLRTADERLAEADNPALTPVRQAIANELAALDAVPQIDRTGLYLALNAQQERISNLRLSQEIEARAVTSGIEEPPTGTFQRQLARFGEELKDLVVIRHHDEALEGLMTPEQEAYLRQSIRLVLEQSQLALLNEEPKLYEASIDKALQLLNDYYDTSREATQSVITRLQELQDAQVKAELPDISASQQELERFIDNRYETRGQSGGDA